MYKLEFYFYEFFILSCIISFINLSFFSLKLQEFVKEENLMPKTAEPSFTFKDIEEDEQQAFITIPRSVIYMS